VTRVLLVGAGGIGAPCAIALAAAGLRELAVVDDDAVELSNLHRQILFSDGDVGRPKLHAFAAALARRAPELQVIQHATRFLPSTAASLLEGVSVVVDATDNFASRFLIADACAHARVAVVHAAAVRWHATVVAVSALGRPCYRCLFEDLPEGPAPDCASAGVVGPVCGVAGAVAADRALRFLAGDASKTGAVVTYDGLTDVLREVRVKRRADCALCGESPVIRSIEEGRYAAEACASTEELSWKPRSESQPLSAR